MKNKSYIYYIIAIIGFLFFSQVSAFYSPKPLEIDNNEMQQPDTNFQKKGIITQLKPGSKEFIDSMKAARQHYIDSLRAAQNVERLRRLDSTKAAQAIIKDSLKRIADSTNLANKKYNDSVKAVLAIQKEERLRIADSLKVVQQARKDSLDRIKAYRESKVYKDSLERVKQNRIDSIANVRAIRADSMAKVRQKIKDSLIVVRQARQDSLATVRKNMQDSIAVVRKHVNDSIQEVITAQKERNKILKDSLVAARTFRTDSLAKVKAEREALSQKRIKDREKAKNAKARDQEKKARDAYSNEKMTKKKWSFIRKTYHNTTTRFNYHFYARERLALVEKNMLVNAADKYDSLLPLFPFNPDTDSTKYASDLDSLIRKASVGIQIHDPRSKWQDNLYLIVGKAYYYKGDYKNAAAAFKFIIASAEKDKKEKAKNKNKKAIENLNSLADPAKSSFLEHESSKNSALLWLARTLSQDKQSNLAQTVLNMLHSSEKYDKSLDGQYATVQSFVDLKTNNNSAAIVNLDPILKDNDLPIWLRQRAAFIKGQLLQKEAKYLASDSAFDKVIDLKPNLEMDLYAKMNKVNNSLNGGQSNTKDLLASLNKMTKESKYKDYFDRIYLAQAQVYEANKDTVNAIANYKKSISNSFKTTTNKGLAFAGLGNIYYIKNDYNGAKSNYDSALAFLTEAQNPSFSIAVQRANALDFIAEPGNKVKYTDSILQLSKMSEKEQLAIVKQKIKNLEKQITDSIYNAKNNANTPSLPGPTTLTSNKQSWYFGNPNTIQQGINNFKQKWGNRTLKDDWNRSNLLSSSISNNDDDQNNLSEEEKLLSNLPTEEQLMAMIPKDKKSIDSANAILETALYELGIGYYKHMEDMPMALQTFDKLDREFPSHKFQDEIIYYRYIIALNKNEKEKANQYLNILQTKYGNSNWTKMVNSAMAKPENSNNNIGIAEHYEQTYASLMSQDYSNALTAAEAAPVLYPNDIGKYEKKYTLIKYACIAGQKEYKNADSLLTLFIALNPNDETINWAKNLQKYVKEQMSITANSNINVTNGNGPNVIADSTLKYEYRPAYLHYVIVSSPITDNKIAGVRAGLRDYNINSKTYNKKEVSISQIDAQRSVVVVTEFKNASEAKKYITEIEKVKSLFKEFSNKSEYDILIISSDNIIKLYSDKNWNAYKAFYEANYK